MRTLAFLLSALLLGLPCAGSLPALCQTGSPAGEAQPACCQHHARACMPGQPDVYCCPTDSTPATGSATEAALPAPSPGPELISIALPGPATNPRPAAFHPAPPLGAFRPALYLLHRSYRS